MSLETFADALEKVAITAGVNAWRSAMAAGNKGFANQIAAAHGALGTTPRYLKDISMGGAEAGVDLMMGRRGAQAATAVPFAQRLDQYRARKAQLGLANRTPSASVMQSPAGRAALLPPTHAPATPGQGDASGYMARKLYKPDSVITRGEHTTELLGQKQEFTDRARALSPEASRMVPAMFGHQQLGEGPMMRHMSFHEYVPNTTSYLSKVTGRTLPDGNAAFTQMQRHVLGPMEQQGKVMRDVVTNQPGGGRSYNPGNIVRTGQGPKVLDFLPQEAGKMGPMQATTMKYLKGTDIPANWESGYDHAPGGLGTLRKEIFKPTQPVVPGLMRPVGPVSPRLNAMQPTIDLRRGAAA